MTRANDAARVGELLPCPFCGGEAKLKPDPNQIMAAQGLVYVTCEPCDLIRDQAFGVTAADAARAWNQRTPTPSNRSE